MLQMIQLGAVLIGMGWLAAEIPVGGEPAKPTQGPTWRRTSEGWMKVGSSGTAALYGPNPRPAAQPALHPGMVAVFMLLWGVLSLSLFERHPKEIGMMQSCIPRPWP